MTTINLIPHEVLLARALRRRMRRWGLRLALTLLVLLGAYGGLEQLVSGGSSEYRELSGECSAIREGLHSAEALVQERDRLLVRRATIAAIQGSAKTGALLTALGDALTPQSYLTFLAVERCAPSPASDAPATDCRGRLHLRGRAPGHREVGQVIRRLEQAKVFREVMLRAITDPIGAAGGGIEFELFCSLEESGQ